MLSAATKATTRLMSGRSFSHLSVRVISPAYSVVAASMLIKVSKQTLLEKHAIGSYACAGFKPSKIDTRYSSSILKRNNQCKKKFRAPCMKPWGRPPVENSNLMRGFRKVGGPRVDAIVGIGRSFDQTTLQWCDAIQ
jgi:hypothetical protein